MTPVKQLLYDTINTLTDLEVEYAVVGGWAVRAFGVPRATYDVDVTVAIDRDRLPELFAALDDLGYDVDEIYQRGWTDDVAGMPLVKARTFADGRPVIADIFLAENVFQQSIMGRKELADINGIKAWVGSPEDIVLMKLVASRHRDLGDIQDIFLMQGTLDEPYMRKWAAELGVADKLKQALKEAQA